MVDQIKGCIPCFQDQLDRKRKTVDSRETTGGRKETERERNRRNLLEERLVLDQVDDIELVLYFLLDILYRKVKPLRVPMRIDVRPQNQIVFCWSKG